MLKKKKSIIFILSFAVVMITLFCVLQQLLMPKYASGVYEGLLISEYYAEEKNHDVIFIGDCEVYENFSPVALWQNFGIPSYIRGSAQQLIWQSYYLLEETIKYEKPKVVIFSVLAMKYDEPQNEAYNRLTLDGMKMSAAKIKAVSASLTEKENIQSYFFPILRYHGRWKELNSDDFKYFSSRPKVSHNGFMMRCDIKPVGVIPEGRKLNNYAFGENSYRYLDKIVDLCKQNNIELMLVKAPSVYPCWYGEWEKQIEDYAAERELLYVNFLENTEEYGLDYSLDTYDGGLHLNCSGAEKLSIFLGSILNDYYNLPDRRTDEKLSALWEKKTEDYERMKTAQSAEIEKNGKISTFFVS